MQFPAFVLGSKCPYEQRVREHSEFHFFHIWGCASMSNTAIIQRCQSKILRALVDAPWYVTNSTIHTDLKIPTVTTVITSKTKLHFGKIATHPNPTMEPLLQPSPQRRLRRIWPHDLRITEV
jgi:hypothetical protein